MLLVDLLEVVERLVRAIVPLGFHGMPFLIFYANPVCLEMSGLQALDDVSCGQIFLFGWRAGFGSAACLISEMPFDVWSGCSACWAISFPISFLMLLVLTFGDSANSCMLGAAGFSAHWFFKPKCSDEADEASL